MSSWFEASCSWKAAPPSLLLTADPGDGYLTYLRSNATEGEGWAPLFQPSHSEPLMTSIVAITFYLEGMDWLAAMHTYVCAPAFPPFSFSFSFLVGMSHLFPALYLMKRGAARCQMARATKGSGLHGEAPKQVNRHLMEEPAERREASGTA